MFSGFERMEKYDYNCDSNCDVDRCVFFWYHTHSVRPYSVTFGMAQLFCHSEGDYEHRNLVPSMFFIWLYFVRFSCFFFFFLLLVHSTQIMIQRWLTEYIELNVCNPTKIHTHFVLYIYKAVRARTHNGWNFDGTYIMNLIWRPFLQYDAHKIKWTRKASPSYSFIYLTKTAITLKCFSKLLFQHLL